MLTYLIFGFLSALQRIGGFISVYNKKDTWFTLYLVGFPMLMFVLHFVLWIGILLIIEYRDQIVGKFKRTSNISKLRYFQPIYLSFLLG